MNITINRRSLRNLLAGGLLITIALGFSVVLALWLDLRLPRTFFRVFDLDAEANLPTWYSSALMLLSACLLWVVARSRDKAEYRGRWLFLALLFLCMSIDETAQLHETLGWPIQQAFQLSGLLYFAWVVVAIPLVGLLMVLYWPLVWALPHRITLMAIAAGCVYLSGVIGVEMVSAMWAEAHGLQHISVKAISALEETLELVGLIFWNYTLLTYLEVDRVRVEFGRV
jgi:hypothetical protein